MTIPLIEYQSLTWEKLLIREIEENMNVFAFLGAKPQNQYRVYYSIYEYYFCFYIMITVLLSIFSTTVNNKGLTFPMKRRE